MDSMSLLVGLLVGIILGSVLSLTLLRRLNAGSSEDAVRAAELTQERGELRTALDSAQDRLGVVSQELAAAQGRLQEMERQRAEDAAESRERESLVEMLHPVRQGVTEMQRRIQELETERAAQQSKLSEQLQTAAQSDQKIIESTQALLGSLHSTTARGHWGEIQLRRIVEASGMLAHVDYTEQHSVSDADGAAQRPDMVVHLPGRRNLIIDAKAPLNASDSGAQAKALRQHINALSSKGYADAVEHSADVIFCFLPAESLLSAALEADHTLLDYALSRGVTLTSPASLLASLKAVETAWRQERLANNMNEIITHSRELYRRLEKMSEHLGRTGDRLRQAVQAYNGLLGNIERQVMPKVESISRLQLSGQDEQTPGSPTELDELGETLRVKQVEAEVSHPGPRLSNVEPHDAARSGTEPSDAEPSAQADRLI